MATPIDNDVEEQIPFELYSADDRIVAYVSHVKQRGDSFLIPNFCYYDGTLKESQPYKELKRDTFVLVTHMTLQTVEKVPFGNRTRMEEDIKQHVSNVRVTGKKFSFKKSTRSISELNELLKREWEAQSQPRQVQSAIHSGAQTKTLMKSRPAHGKRETMVEARSREDSHSGAVKNAEDETLQDAPKRPRLSCLSHAEKLRRLQAVIKSMDDYAHVLELEHTRSRIPDALQQVINAGLIVLRFNNFSQTSVDDCSLLFEHREGQNWAITRMETVGGRESAMFKRAEKCEVAYRIKGFVKLYDSIESLAACPEDVEIVETLKDERDKADKFRHACPIVNMKIKWYV